jgi:hypothetical protein
MNFGFFDFGLHRSRTKTNGHLHFGLAKSFLHEKRLMYPRLMQPPPWQSFFLFGPRGVGKTAWLHQQFPSALFFDMLDHQVYTQLLAGPERLASGGPSSATTRSRSVTRIVSPRSARRTYSLSLFFRTFIPTTLIFSRVASTSRFFQGWELAAVTLC